MSKIFDSIQVSGTVKRYIDHSFDVVDQIHEILENQGKTQRDLAEMMDKKESEISKWMRGTHNFTLKSIAKIEAALGERIITTPRKVVSKTKFIPVYVYSGNQGHVDSDSQGGGKWSGQANVMSNDKGLKVA